MSNPSNFHYTDPVMNLILASQSPRRRELLATAGYAFTVSPVKVSEIFDENMNPAEVPGYLAAVKARAALDQHKSLRSNGNLILGADTIVVLKDRVLGKPRDLIEAVDHLARLSGQTHHVITGVTLLRSGGAAPAFTTAEVTRTTATAVTFRALSVDEIKTYVATGDSLDKAGGYGIQGAARNFVSSIEGSWSNVVGLPLETLTKVLHDHQWTVGRRTPDPR